MWCWMLKYAVVESCWTKIEHGSIPLNKLPQQCSAFVDQQELNDLEPCIIRLNLNFDSANRDNLFTQKR